MAEIDIINELKEINIKLAILIGEDNLKQDIVDKAKNSISLLSSEKQV